MDEKPDCLISSYKRAFLAANGRALQDDAVYADGWFVFTSRSMPGIVRRYRRERLERLRDNLNERASQS